jgi:hypothetical protein
MRQRQPDARLQPQQVQRTRRLGMAGHQDEVQPLQRRAVAQRGPPAGGRGAAAPRSVPAGWARSRCPPARAGSRRPGPAGLRSSAGAMASAGSCTASTRTPGASRPTPAISCGRNSSAPMSLMCSTKRRCDRAASKLSASCSATSSWRSASSTCRASWSALGVGATPPVHAREQRVVQRQAQPGQRVADRRLRQAQRSAARLTLRAACTAETRAAG